VELHSYKCQVHALCYVHIHLRLREVHATVLDTNLTWFALIQGELLGRQVDIQSLEPSMNSAKARCIWI